MLRKNMRKFSFLTLNDLIEEVKQSGVPRFSRSTFYRMVKKYGWIPPVKTMGGWRRFEEGSAETPGSIKYYIKKIKEAYSVPV